MRYMIESYYFDSGFATQKVSEVLFGFTTPVADRINGGNFW